MNDSGPQRYRDRLAVLNQVLRHDVRNRAGIIIGNAELLLEENDEQRRAETIRETAYDMVDRTDVARQVATALDAKMGVQVDLTEQLRSSIDRQRSAYPSAEINASIPENVRVTATEQLTLVFDHVIENGIEHNNTDSPVVSVSVTEPGGDHVTIELADNGPGIPESEQEIIEGTTADDVQRSRGLGLCLVNWLVVDSGGTVTVGENEPTGSVVSIELPRADGIDE